MSFRKATASLIVTPFILIYSASCWSQSVPAGVQPEFSPRWPIPEKSGYWEYAYTLSPTDSSHTFDVLKYILNIKLVPTHPTNKFRGQATIYAKSEIDGLTAVGLSFLGMTVDSCKVNSTSAVYSIPVNMINITLDQTYNTGDSFYLDVFYHGIPAAGFYFESNAYGTPIYYSITEPYDSRYWFPCYNYPNDKALSEVICTVPAVNKTVSNGVLVSTTNNPDTTTTYHWKEDYPIAMYLISLTACDFARIDTFATVNGDALPISYWIYHQDSSEAAVDFQKTPAMVEFFSNIWLDYPFPNDKYSNVQAELGGAMEHQTCTSWGFPMPGDARYEWVNAHELGHQWWGNLVTCNDFANIWLNEGFASYSEVLWLEHEYGQTTKKNHLISMRSAVYAARNGSVSFPIYNPPNAYLFGTAVYDKGAWVLHMLRYILGDSLFLNGMADYGQTYAYGTANTVQFLNAMESYSEQDLDWFFNEWVFAPNYPRYIWNWAYTQIGTDYYLDVGIKQNQTNPSVYRMPIELKLQTTAGDTIVTVLDSLKQQSFSFVNGQEPTGVELDPNFWILKADTLGTYPYLAGDVNADSATSLSDIIHLVNILFKGATLPSEPVPVSVVDVNGDCHLSLADVIHYVNRIFHSGPILKLGCN
ncbi:MAG: M1 family metallopeptidase [candidate division Zixibacteria bacterium]|nr:M1 family metallopeptidase [candidate division Zixibacteria bacterium]